MTQIKDLSVTKTASLSTDLLVLQDPISGSTYQITVANFLSGLSSGSTLWTPSQIASGLWLDFSDSNNLAVDSSSRISIAYDKSQYGRHFYQSNTANEPTLITGANSKTVASFNGTSDYISIGTGVNFGNTFTFCFVAKPSTVNAIGLFDSAPNQSYVVRQNPAGYVEWWNLSPEISAGFIASQYAIYEYNYDFTNHRTLTSYINGVQGSSVNNSNTTGAAWTTLNFGSINISQAFFSGQIGEIILLPFTLSPVNRQKVEGYLANKWGLQASLPTGHPYKTTPPTV